MTIDLDFMEKVEGVEYDMLQSRIRTLCAAVRTLRAEAREREDTLTKHQAESTRLREEVRDLRHDAKVAGTPEGAMLLEGIRALAAARAKYPVTEALPYMLCVLGEEAGEASRAFCHAEGSQRLRDELAQVIATAVRIAVDRANECPTKEPKSR